MDNNEELVKDVVCGMVKPENQFRLFSDFNGKTYYFCSQGDKDLFDAYPDRWVTKEVDGKNK